MLHVWLALALFALLPIVGAVVLFGHVRQLWRDLKRGGGAIANGLDELSERLERISERAGTLETAPRRMEPSVARLRTSLSELAVLRSAVRDVQDAVGRVTAIDPRK